MRHSSCTSIITGALRSRRIKRTAKSERRVVSVRSIVNIGRRIPCHFSRLRHSRPPADQDQLRAENARLRTSLTTVLASSKIRSRRRSKRRDRGARIALWRSPTRRVVANVFPLSGVLQGTRVPLGGTGVLGHRVQHILMPPKRGPFFAIYFIAFFDGACGADLAWPHQNLIW